MAGRSRKKTNYDGSKILNDYMEIIAKEYSDSIKQGADSNKSFRAIAAEYNISRIKLRKLLITAGVYHSDISDRVNELFSAGKTVEEISKLTGLKKSSINSYLPYNKVLYNAKEKSVGADRVSKYRQRQRLINLLQDEVSEDALWDCIVAFQNYTFYTVSGLSYKYEIKRGMDGTYNRELVIDVQKMECVILDWSSIVLVFYNAVSLDGIVSKTEESGDIDGISYIYPVLCRFGVVDGVDEGDDGGGNQLLSKELLGSDVKTV